MREVTTPTIISQTPLPTNQVAVCKELLSLSVSATAPGQNDGFPLSYQWKFNGANISGATSASYTLLGDTNTWGGTNSTGAYSVTVTNAAGSASAAWQVTVTYEGSYIAPGMLAYHLATNAVGRAAGLTGSDTDKFELDGWIWATYWDTNMMFLTNSVWATNFWLRGVQGLSATSIGTSNGTGGPGLVTLVSPRHYLYATHVGAGETIAFLDTNNVIHWRTTLGRVDIGNETSVGIFNSNLPPSVGYSPIVPGNLWNHLPTNSWSVVQGIGMNQNMRVFSQPMTFDSQGFVSWDSRTPVPFGLGTNWNVATGGGDSSAPVRLLIENQVVLISHNTTGGVSGSGPNHALQFELINQYMHYLSTNYSVGTDYQLTPFPLTNWPSIH